MKMENEIVQLRAELAEDGNCKETKVSGEEIVRGSDDWCLCQDRLREQAPNSTCHSEKNEHLDGTLQTNLRNDLSMPREVDRNLSQTSPLVTLKSSCIVSDMMPACDDLLSSTLISKASDIETGNSCLQSCQLSAGRQGEASAELPYVTTETQSVVDDCRRHAHCDCTNVTNVSDDSCNSSELAVKRSCVQSDECDTNEISPACDASSCLLSEDIVIADSEDDLFCSPAASVVVSSDCSQQPDSLVVLLNTVDAHISQMPDDTSNSLSKDVNQGQIESQEKYSIHVSHVNHECTSRDTDNTDVVQHADCLRNKAPCSGINNAHGLHQQLTTSLDVHERIPKRPHWSLVVSGISSASDQVS